MALTHQQVDERSIYALVDKPAHCLAKYEFFIGEIVRGEGLGGTDILQA